MGCGPFLHPDLVGSREEAQSRKMKGDSVIKGESTKKIALPDRKKKKKKTWRMGKVSE